MKINITVNGQNQFEYFLNTLLLGCITAILNKKANIADMENLIFNPRIAKYLTENFDYMQCINIITLGMELEHIESLVPECLDDELIKLQNMLLDNFNNLKLSNHTSINITAS